VAEAGKLLSDDVVFYAIAQRRILDDLGALVPRYKSIQSMIQKPEKNK
jgi:hypothetical protein